MSESHLAYLNLGSNIQPEINLRKAVKLLSNCGKILKVSNIWESEPVGTKGANYLNICLSFKSSFSQTDLKTKVIHPTENQLGRTRSRDKFAPRAIDIDIILFDNQPVSKSSWHLAYVVVPLADIYPDYQIPHTGKFVQETARRLSTEVWLRKHTGWMDHLNGSS